MQGDSSPKFDNSKKKSHYNPTLEFRNSQAEKESQLKKDNYKSMASLKFNSVNRTPSKANKVRENNEG